MVSVDEGRVPLLPWVVLVVLASAGGPLLAAVHSVEGAARDPVSGNLLYREQHLVRSADARPVERLVLYRCPGGEAFARKRVDYRPSLLAPSFALEDARAGYREGLRRADGKTVVWSGQDAPRALSGAATGLVADAGFDEFLRTHWASLLAGRAQPLAFVVPSLGRSLAFQVRPRGRGEIDGAPVEQFRLKLDGLLGAVGPNMEVAYDAGDRRLRRFTGLTNLRDDRGRQMRARIDFPQPARLADEAAWQAGQRAPLTRCRLGV